MKILTLILLFSSFAFYTNAQMDVETTSRNSTLDLRGSMSNNLRTFSASTSARTTDYHLVFTGTFTATGDATTTVDIASNRASSFGTFAIANRSFSLPLMFLSFTAQKKNDHVQLKWVTAEEMNTNYFEVEQSHDGVQFSSLFKMPTTNRFTTLEYSYRDYSYIGHLAFYRIRCVDKDGSSKFSKIVALVESSYLKRNIHILNPVTDEIIIRCQVDEKESRAYVLYNQAGSAIQKGNLN